MFAATDVDATLVIAATQCLVVPEVYSRVHNTYIIT